MEDRNVELAKKPKVSKFLCLQDTADDRFLYEAGKTYDLPEDHPCIQYFEPVEETG